MLKQSYRAPPTRCRSPPPILYTVSYIYAGLEETMDLKEGIRHMMRQGGMTQYRLSHSLGKSTNYMSNMLLYIDNPRYATISSIANLCGYDIVFRSRDGLDEITLDPHKVDSGD